jgi:hypothetical protein
MKNYTVIDKCPITDDNDKVMYFDLGSIPLVNNLLDTREESIVADRYPLNINYYTLSGETALSISVNGDLLFSNYLFKSEVNKPYYKHCQEMFLYSKRYIKNFNNISVIDIGGNDGTLLDAFRSVGDTNLSLLNIDPSKNLCKLCDDKNIPYINDFFNYDLSLKISEKVDIVTSTNVFQHLLDINSFAKGVENLLKDDGIWILEFPYWIHDMETNQFDQIYHEHMYYHTVKPMKMMMEKHNMRIINVTKQNIHGGTLRLIITKNNSDLETDNTVEYYINSEKKYDLNFHINWGKNVQNHIDNSSKFIKSIVEDNKTIYGFGAAAKGCIYLNSMGIDYRQIEYVIDDTDLKQNKFIPGTGIKIVSREILKEKKPDYILILAHNFAEHIIDSLKDHYDGKYILLIPEIKII